MPPSNAPSAQLLAVSVGLPRRVAWRGEEVETGIFKASVEGRVAVGRLGLEGDGQADLSVHGGVDKAVYAYDQSGLDFWRGELDRPELGYGAFGENLSLRGATEETTRLGDVLRVGTARLQVSQPRQPCFKLGLRFEDPRFPKRFLASGRVGFYLRVLEEGDVAAGDAVEVEVRDTAAPCIRDLVRAAFGLAGATPEEMLDVLDTALAHEALADDWRTPLRERRDTLRARLDLDRSRATS